MTTKTNEEWVTVEGSLSPPKDVTARQKFYTNFAKYVSQIEQDALYGTFGDFDPSIFRSETAYKSFKTQSKRLSKCTNITKMEDKENSRPARFRLKLASSEFSDPQLGLQKLVHVLVSDLFERRVSDEPSVLKVDKVDISALEKKFISHYRKGSWSKKQIREAFGLKKNEPLLAFTIKPRSGLTPSDYKHIVRSTLEGGFHVVEMDTRDLDIQGSDRRRLLRELSQIALDTCSENKVRRFSANLSGPAYAIRDVLMELHDLHQEGGRKPWMVKVDGNLDGLSTIQAIRNGFGDITSLAQQPIITCYPVLKYGLIKYIPGETFVRMLALSGADIIYPGKRPIFPIDHAIEGEELQSSKDHYEESRMLPGTAQEFPLLSVAGGINIGQVHAIMALLGGDIAFFVGGGLALSKKGLPKAAEAFTQACLIARTSFSHAEWDPQIFKDQFVPLTNIYRKGGETLPKEFEYFNVCKLVGQTELTHEPDSVKS